MFQLHSFFNLLQHKIQHRVNLDALLSFRSVKDELSINAEKKNSEGHTASHSSQTASQSCSVSSWRPSRSVKNQIFHPQLSLVREGRWATTNEILQPVFSVFPCPLGLAELQACPFPDVVFLPLPLSASSSSPFHCALQDGFGQTWWTGNMTIPLKFASLYDGQEVFVCFNCLLDLGTDFLVGNMVFVWDV